MFSMWRSRGERHSLGNWNAKMMLVLYKNWLPGLCNTGILHCNLTSALLLIFFLLLFRQISLDCMFLESQSIIDYSMLLGIHFRAPEHLRSHLDQDTALLASGNSVARNCDTSISSVFVKTFELLFIFLLLSFWYCKYLQKKIKRYS